MKPLRLIVPFAVFLLIAAACTSDDDGGGGGETGTTGAALEENTGTVNVLNAMEPNEGEAVQAAVDENLQNADYAVEIEASADFEEQFAIRSEGGTLDIALVPQPGTVQQQAEAGTIVSLEDLGIDVGALQEAYGEYLFSLVEVDGEHYGIPTNVNLKSMVWYPKDDFDKAGYQVPTTWDEMLALSDQIVADGGAMVRGLRVRRRDRMAGHRLDGRHHAPDRRRGHLRPVGHARDPVHRPGGRRRGRGVREHHVHGRVRARRSGRHALDLVRLGAAADVRGPAGLLAPPPGDLHHRGRAVPRGRGGGRRL